jgi:hypothetical protein
MKTALNFHPLLGSVEMRITNLAGIVFQPCTTNIKHGTHNGTSYRRGLRKTISAVSLKCVVLAHGKHADHTACPRSLSDMSHPFAGQKRNEFNRNLVDYSTLFLFTSDTFVSRLCFIYRHLTNCTYCRVITNPQRYGSKWL